MLGQHLSEMKIRAAEELLQTFHELLPELYGQRSCTANAHCLTHMPRFVRLWGPLWTHSAFGFESMNGHIHRMFHSRSNIVDQLTFAIDVSQTLQQLSTPLSKIEDEMTLDYLSFFAGTLPRKNMVR